MTITEGFQRWLFKAQG